MFMSVVSSAPKEMLHAAPSPLVNSCPSLHLINDVDVAALPSHRPFLQNVDPDYLTSRALSESMPTSHCESLLEENPELLTLDQSSRIKLTRSARQENANKITSLTTTRQEPSPKEPGKSSRQSLSESPCQDFPPVTSPADILNKNCQSTILHSLSPNSTIKLAEKILLRNITLEKENKNLKKQLQKEKSGSIKSFYFLQGRFGEDQIRALKFKRSQGAKWKPETIKKALQLRFACGSQGYETVSKLQMPVPSIRCLQMNVRKVSFDPRVLSKFIQLMPTKVNISSRDRFCVLGIDEMSITMGSTYDNGNSSLLGHCTLPGSKGMVSKAVVGALGGICARYKQTVMWHLTGSSGNPEGMGNVILQIVKEAHEVGLYVLTLVSDFGMRDTMNYLGFRCKRDAMIWKIPHPCLPGQFLYWMPDPIHIFKNVSGMLVSKEEIKISPEIVEDQDLPSDTVCKSHLERLIVDYQEDMDYSYAHKLKRKDFAGNHFSVMKVDGARHLFSMPTACGLFALSDTEPGCPEMMTSAWFTIIMDRWFSLMTNRSFKMALSKKYEDSYNQAVQLLELVIEIFKTLDAKGSWHPQTALIMATEAFLEITVKLFELGIDFVLSGRFLQNFIENIFSLIRIQCRKPTALLFKYRLKELTVSQFFKSVKTAVYDPDGRTDVVDLTSLYEFVETKTPKQPEMKKNFNEFPAGWRKNQDQGKLAEPQYRTYEYLLHCVKKYDKVCDDCYSAAVHTGEIKHPASSFVTASNYKEGAQVEVSDAVFQMLRRADLIFKREETTLINVVNANIYFKQRTSHLLQKAGLPTCHGIGEKLFRRFVEFRLKRLGTLLSQKVQPKDRMVQLSSKTMGSGLLADQYCTKKARK